MGFRTVVVASASEIQRTSLDQHLKSVGGEVVMADSAERVDPICQSWDPAVAVIDAGMEQGSGLRAIKALRESGRKRMAVMALVPSLQLKVVYLALKAGADDVAILGGDARKLSQRIQKWMEERNNGCLDERRRMSLATVERKLAQQASGQAAAP